ncbi:MAG: hypothetical protein HWN81_00285 [Candidatus Lokiarchaeota archaeon]|nr:hypothetical protein [Candidatus Lokiarchaeota archaeon]
MKENKYYYSDGGVLDYYDWDKKLHRLDGPAIEYSSGSKEWWIEDKLHRLDGPACEYANGHKCWYVEDKRHRLDGPAVEWADGDKEWYVGGEELTYEEFEAHPKRQDYLASLAIEEILSEKR